MNKTKKPVRQFRWLRRLTRVLAVLIILLIVGCFVFDHYVQFRRSDEDMTRIFHERNVNASIHYYTSHGRKLRYISAGEDSLPTLLMLHGSPGSISYYGGRFADSIIRNSFKAYAVDRPGYGYSGFGDPEPSIEKQAAMIRPLLDSLHHAKRPIIIVAGSYGASVACRMAMDFPHLVDGLVLTGPALGPGREVYFWFTPVIEHWSIRWFIPRLFRSANTEKYHHKEELEKMLPYWKNIRVPVVYIQGVNDNIVDTSNASFAREQMVNSPWLDIRFVSNREHRLAQYEWPRIRQGIMDVYEKVKMQAGPR